MKLPSYSRFLIAIALLVLLTSQSHAIHVTFSFDDGWDNHYNSSMLMDEFGYKATYYINSNKLDTLYRLSTSQLTSMGDAGHEVAGHTITHARLTNLTRDQQEAEICGDRSRE